MSPLGTQHDSQRYWRSLGDLAGRPEFDAFLKAEFPAAADPDGMSRRRWLQLMGASLVLAGAAGCRWEKREIVPPAVRPEDRVPGVPQRFATAMDLAGSAVGLLVTSVDGRPIKIEGNPRHSQSGGATDALAQAAILQLYDPDRSDAVCRLTTPEQLSRTWDEFAAFAHTHFAALRKADGAGLRILAEANSSPTLARLRQRLLQEFPRAQWHEYEPLSDDNVRAGAKLAFGKPYRTQLALEDARVIVCLDADLLGEHPAAVQYARALTKGREPAGGTMSRLYAIESCYSLTGAAADHRLPLRSAEIATFALALEREVRLRSGASGKLPAVANDPPGAGGSVSAAADHTGGQAARGTPARFVRAIAKDLVAQRGKGIVTAGPRQPPEVHAAVHRMNAVLENVGKTVTYTADPEPERPLHVDAIRSLVGDMNAGKVQTLLILGGNPVYDVPADLGFSEALAKVSERIRLGLYRDETSQRCTWHLPQAHFLESWGDARSYDGSYSIIQPLIEPLRNGRSAIELLAMLAVSGKGTVPFSSNENWDSPHPPPKADQLVRETFNQLAGPRASDGLWTQSLHDGLLADSRWPAEAAQLLGGSEGDSPIFVERKLGQSPTGSAPQRGNLEIVFCRSAAVYDGRFANNGWLQELPDPMTRLTWDNAAVISPATAEALSVEDGTLVRLKYAGREVEIPAYVMPGQAADSIAVALGYGRTAAGQVGGSVATGVAPVGVDVYPLRTSRARDFDMGLVIEPTGRKYPLAATQEHHAIDAVGAQARQRRAAALVREATLAEYQKDPHFAQPVEEHPPVEPLWKEPPWEGHRWGMTIDLSRCIGCNACMVACQAENNVPIVGKERVLRGREMHWIRVDRYFQGPAEAPQAVHQPVACQQCEMAPCEQVCPVGATVHSKEGLNDMVYNRCVGTRYCSNNCPYKVRRFNFFNYHKDLEDPAHEIAKMVYNPEVTIRHRGVMEKCTYCIQRIQAVKIAAENDRRPIADGEIRTACQQVCPAQAIVFGDLADAASQVARAQRSDRAYALLGDMNFRPRTMYLAKIRNPHPELANANRGLSQFSRSENGTVPLSQS